MSWISKWIWRKSRPDKQLPSILQSALDNQKQRKDDESKRPVYLSTVAPPDAEKLKELLKEWHKQPMLFTPATPVYDWPAIESDYMKANMEMAIKRGSGFLAYETVEWFKKRIK